MFAIVCQSRRHFRLKPSSKYTYLMRGIAQQRLRLSIMHWDALSLPHQLERCPNRIQDSPWDFQWNFGSSMDLHQVFGAFLTIVVASLIYHSHLRIRLGNCAQARINRLASMDVRSTSLDILHHTAAGRLQLR